MHLDPTTTPSEIRPVRRSVNREFPGYLFVLANSSCFETRKDDELHLWNNSLIKEFWARIDWLSEFALKEVETFCCRKPKKWYYIIKFCKTLTWKASYPDVKMHHNVYIHDCTIQVHNGKWMMGDYLSNLQNILTLLHLIPHLLCRGKTRHKIEKKKSRSDPYPGGQLGVQRGHL